MLGECGPLIGAAKNCELTVITEIYILLSAERILAEEQRRFPEWEPEPIDFDGVRNKFAEQRELLNQTDYAVCPSEIVRGDLEREFKFGEGRSAVVPYGVDGGWLTATVWPVTGRVLFGGTAGLRKGIHHLAKASELLQGRRRLYEFRIAGEVTQRIARLRECRHLTFLGRVPRDQVQAEFASADVFVLPSVAEGSAEATYEALAAGLPVITTEAAGSVVRHGIDGWVVPERDSVALAEAIERIIGDRHLRATMSLAARERAREYTVERYGERLVAALQRFRA
jgi:glycosyltransferase involved in cell wall biosynthesis